LQGSAGWEDRAPNRMELSRVIRKLYEERAKLDHMIASLEQLEQTVAAREAKKPKKRGRKSMDEKARREVSERMRKYWALRRGKDGSGPSSA
jgi:uncharacterized protein YdcH (DUF465 family)